MKRIFAFILTLLFVGSALPAGAEVVERVLLSGGTLTVSGSLPEEAEENITISILKENVYWTKAAAGLSGNPAAKTLEDYKAGDNIFDYLAWFGQISAEAGESYTLTIPGYTGPSEPEMRFRISDGNYYFYSPRELEAVNAAATKEELKNSYRASSFLWNAISVTYEKIKTVELEDKFWQECLDFRNALENSKFSAFAHAAEAAEPCYFLARLDLCADRSGLEELYQEFKAEGKSSDSYDIYLSDGDFSRKDGAVYMSEKQKDALAENLLKNKDKFTKPGDFIDSFNEKIVLYAVSSSASKELVADVLDNSELFSEIISDYHDLTKAQRLQVAKLVNDEEPYDSISDLDDDISDFCKTVLKQSSTGSGSTGSSGGSGGGGGSAASIGRAPSADNAKKVCRFDDLDGVAWAKEAISSLYLSGIVNGREETKFDPSGLVSRAEFVKMLVLAAGGTDSTAIADFSDTKATDWHYPYIATAVKKGLIKGTGNGNFGTSDTIMRQDMAVMLARALGADVSLSESGFSDDSYISDYAKGAVSFVQKKGIMNGMGDNRFDPAGKVTRAQAAKVIYEFLKGGAR